MEDCRVQLSMRDLVVVQALKLIRLRVVGANKAMLCEKIGSRACPFKGWLLVIPGRFSHFGGVDRSIGKVELPKMGRGRV